MLGAANPAHWLFDRGFMEGYARGYEEGYRKAQEEKFNNTGTSNFVTDLTYMEVFDEARGTEGDS